MSKTTLIKRRQDMVRQPLPECHDGKGALDWINVLSGADTEGKHINFIHDNILPPGVSIGIHTHDHDEEYYYYQLRVEMRHKLVPAQSQKRPLLKGLSRSFAAGLCQI